MPILIVCAHYFHNYGLSKQVNPLYIVLLPGTHAQFCMPTVLNAETFTHHLLRHFGQISAGRLFSS